MSFSHTTQPVSIGRTKLLMLILERLRMCRESRGEHVSFSASQHVSHVSNTKLRNGVPVADVTYAQTCFSICCPFCCSQFWFIYSPLFFLFCAFTEKVDSYLTMRSSFGGGRAVLISEINSVALKLP